MMWFGHAHGAPYEADTPHAPTPIGQPCGRCEEVFIDGDSGLIVPHIDQGGTRQVGYHYECHLRAIVGGLNHQLKRCICCGGTEPPDPAGVSRREAARFALAHWSASRGPFT